MEVNKVILINGGSQTTPIDLTTDTANAGNVTAGKKIHLASGVQVTGTALGAKGFVDGSLTSFDNTGIEATNIMPNRFQNFTSLENANFTGITTIPNYVCDGCTALETLTLASSTETIGTNAFKNTYAVSSFTFGNPNALKSIGDYGFSGLGSSRTIPSSNIFNIDLSNTKLASIGQYAFGTADSTNKNKYMNIKFPSTLSSIGAYAFAYSDNVNLYFTSASAPTLQSTSFNSVTNMKLYIPFGAMHSFQTATNWSTHTSKMVGYAAANTFETNELLPDYNAEGYALTWYSDEACTTTVTTATNPANIYYCTIGAEKVAVGITQLYADNCTLSVTGNDGRTYKVGYGVLPDVVLTISATPTSGYQPYIYTLNGTTITNNYQYTVVADTDVQVVAIYWDGVNVPASPVFGDNSWAIISSIIGQGKASEIGWSVGDTKSETYSGTTVTVRLSDLQEDRYQFADGSGGTHAVLEFVELLPTSYKMNNSGTNAGGWASSVLNSNLNNTLIANLSPDLQAALKSVKIKSANGGSTNYSGITESNCKLFIPAEAEIASRSYSYSGEGTKWDYYVTHTTANDRKKYKPGSSSAVDWWLRSPSSSGTNYFCYVYNNGGVGNYVAGNSYGVCVCFAL